MAFTKKELVTSGSIIYLIIITAVASFATTRSNYLSLPISTSLKTLTAALPLLAGAFLQTAHTLTRAHHARQKSLIAPSPAPPYIAVARTAVLIFAAVLLSLLGTHLGSGADLLCGLETRWAGLFSKKDGEAIRRIQDALRCCGFKNAHDRAWPFPDRSHGADACELRFERHVGCLGRWRGEERKMAGVLVGMVCAVVVWELIIIINPRLRRPSWLSSVLPHRRLQLTNGDEEGQNTTDPRRGITFPAAAERYSDNSVVEAIGSEDDEPTPRRMEEQVAGLFSGESRAMNGGDLGRGQLPENEWARAGP